MTEQVKAAHSLAQIAKIGADELEMFSWLCECGSHDHGFISKHMARDAHAEHAQESGEYGLPGGFEVVESLHGESCAGCRDAARSAAIHARVMGSVGATYQVNEPSDPWDDPEVAHSARVERPKNQE